jgi:septum formation protein
MVYSSTVAATFIENPPLVLGSTSRYRRELLARLHVPFTVAAPHTDETTLANESPRALAARLGQAKAAAVFAQYPHAYVIGSDQVAHCEGLILGKSGGYDRAVVQLRHMRGRVSFFDTAMTVLGPNGFARSVVVPVEVKLRDLHDDEIDRYLRTEEPYDCAGSAKSEGLGIALMEYLRGDDPTALVGLPLIALTHILREAGFRIPA